MSSEMPNESGHVLLRVQPISQDDQSLVAEVPLLDHPHLGAEFQNPKDPTTFLAQALHRLQSVRTVEVDSEKQALRMAV